MRIGIFLLVLFPCLLFVSGCGDLDESLTPGDMIQSLTFSETYGLLADGRTISVEAIIHPDAREDFREVLFTSSGGAFSDAVNGDLIIKAIKDKGVLKANAKFQAPMIEGLITINAEIVIPDERGNYVVSKELLFGKSIPSSISLESEAFSVYNNFDGNIDIKGVLKNLEGNGVDHETKVELKDYFSDNTPVNGRFKNDILLINSMSEISTSYSPGYIQPDQTIKVVALVLDESGSYVPGVTDTLLIEVIEKP